MNREDKLKKIIDCFDIWMYTREEGCRIDEYLKKRKVQAVGIYGYGKLGRHLLKELLDTEIEVKWLMDKKDVGETISCPYLDSNSTQIPLDIDIVINTALGNIEEVEKKFIDLGFNRVITLDELLGEIRYHNKS